MKNGIHRKIAFLIFIFFLFSSSSMSEAINGKSVSIKILDKVTSRVKELNIDVGNSLDFATLNIEIFACLKRPPEEIPEDFVLLEIKDDIFDQKNLIVYRGWMISSSPSVTPFEHPIYDIWINDCKIDIDSE